MLMISKEWETKESEIKSTHTGKTKLKKANVIRLVHKVEISLRKVCYVSLYNVSLLSAFFFFFFFLNNSKTS